MRIFPRFDPPAERRCKDAETIDRAVQTLTALAAFGHEQVPVSRVLELLGHKPDEPDRPPPPELDPRADPMTGCLPVTAQPSGLDRVQEAVRAARGGDPPAQPRGFA